MKLTSLIGHTLELYGLTQNGSTPADQVVDRFFRGRRYLGSRDRRFIAETVYGMLRHKLLIENLFQTALRELNGTEPTEKYQSAIGSCLTYLSVVKQENPRELVKTLESYWKVSFPRIPLERFFEVLEQKTDLRHVGASAADRLSVKHSFHKWMVEEWLSRFGEAETESLCQALNTPAPLTVRVNTLKTPVDDCRRRLEKEGVDAIPTKLSPFGLVIGKRVNLHTLDSFKEGWIEVQDEASQIVPLLLNPASGQTVVDSCAGSGGKSLELSALMKNQGRVIAFDVDERRLKNLRLRAERAGVHNVETHLIGRNSRNGGRKDLENVDAVLIDAPCSGLGTLRRNPGNKWKVSQKFVAQVAAQQRKLLKDWSPLVRVGGRLVYATCTLLRQENEEVVEDFLKSHREFELVPVGDALAPWGLADRFPGHYLELYPHRKGTDGFFAALMVRQGE